MWINAWLDGGNINEIHRNMLTHIAKQVAKQNWDSLTAHLSLTDGKIMKQKHSVTIGRLDDEKTHCTMWPKSIFCSVGNFSTIFGILTFFEIFFTKFFFHYNKFPVLWWSFLYPKMLKMMFFGHFRAIFKWHFSVNFHYFWLVLA